MTEQLEYVGLVLEDQLLDHLATPEGAMAIWKERLIPEVIPESEEGVREALAFVMEYMDEYREPPDVSVLSEETGYDEFNVPVAPVEYVIAKLRDRYKRKELRKVITKMGRLSGEPEESLHYGLDELMRLRMETSAVGTTITSHDLHSTVDEYIARRDNPADGLTFGYPQMDDALGGLSIGEVVVVLARPKRYKSWQLLKTATENYLNGDDIFFETMEMPEWEMRNRFHCMLGGVSWYKFKHNHLTNQDLDILRKVADLEQLNEHKMTFHRSKIGERKAPLIVELAREKNAKALFVDQMSWFDGAKDEGNWRIIGQIMEQLKDGSMHFPIMVAAQYNRVQAKEEGIGDIANIGLADAIGQTADMLLGIYGSQDMLANKVIHYGVVESRNFEKMAWEVLVKLTEEANFKMANVIDVD